MWSDHTDALGGFHGEMDHFPLTASSVKLLEPHTSFIISFLSLGVDFQFGVFEGLLLL